MRRTCPGPLSLPGTGPSRGLTGGQQSLILVVVDTEKAWWLRAACKELTPEEADQMFFPGPGGKPHKANNFCVSQCPVRDMCVAEAITNHYSGFFGGLTDAERAAAGRINMSIKESALLRGAVIVPDGEEAPNRPYKIIEAPSRDRSWMDEVEPDDSSLNLIELLGNNPEVWDLVS